jgi:hypothetical protein
VSLEVSRCFVENKDGTFSIQTPSLSDHPDEQYNKEGINNSTTFTKPDPELLSQVRSGIIVLELDPNLTFLSIKYVFSGLKQSSLQYVYRYLKFDNSLVDLVLGVGSGISDPERPEK